MQESINKVMDMRIPLQLVHKIDTLFDTTKLLMTLFKLEQKNGKEWMDLWSHDLLMFLAFSFHSNDIELVSQACVSLS